MSIIRWLFTARCDFCQRRVFAIFGAKSMAHNVGLCSLRDTMPPESEWPT